MIGLDITKREGEKVKQNNEKRAMWKAEYEAKNAMANEALKRFINADLYTRDRKDFEDYKRLMKESNKAFGIMLRCGIRVKIYN